jgi:hypothetical protein
LPIITNAARHLRQSEGGAGRETTTNWVRASHPWYDWGVKVHQVLGRRSTAQLGPIVALLVPLGCSGCVTPPKQPHEEVETRQATPISVCTTQLAPPRRKASGKAVVRSLDPEQWLEVMVPSFDRAKGLSATDPDCTGHYLFANEELRYGMSKQGWPRKVDPDELEIASGPEGMRVLWLRSLTFENGDVGGPVALVRALDDRAEIYGIGSLRAPPDVKLTPVRVGNEPLVVAEAKRCPDPTSCRTSAHFYLVRRGRLIDAATVDVDRVQRVPSVTERGLYAEYQLKTDVTYESDGILLLEQVQVRIIPYEQAGDRDSDRVLRKVEFTRKLKVERDSLFATNESLWERVVGQD